MTAATPATTAPKTTTRKPAPKKARSLRLLKWDATTLKGVLAITEGKESAVYSIEQIDAGYAERAFRLAKLSSVCSEPVGIESPYCVALERQGNSCECMGHLRHGHKTVCRHIAAVSKLIELDLI